MNSNSIENIKCLYGWLEENPNKNMHQNGYSVIVFDCYDTLDTNPKDGCGFKIREHIFGSKEEAWFFFEEDLCYGRRDWWDEVVWTDDYVVSTLYDEGGWTHVWIEKWDGFDNDIEFSWKYNDIKYKSLKDLWEAVPIFQGHHMTTDKPWISVLDRETNTWFHAELNIELSESFKTSCDKWIEEKKKAQEEAKEAEERRKKEYEEEINNLTNCTDLPF